MPCLPVLAFLTLLSTALNRSQEQPTVPPNGMFESHGDVGTVLHPGTAVYDQSSRRYTLTGSGENMWLSADAYHFVWKKVSGDVALTADISFPHPGGNEHRKAVLMVRQS